MAKNSVSRVEQRLASQAIAAGHAPGAATEQAMKGLAEKLLALGYTADMMSALSDGEISEIAEKYFAGALEANQQVKDDADAETQLPFDSAKGRAWQVSAGKKQRAAVKKGEIPPWQR